MCELFAMSFNQPVRPSISFNGFRRRGKQNPDGWGLALYPDKLVQTSVLCINNHKNNNIK